MPQLQPYISNVPLSVAKNLRFVGSNGIPVTEMLPIGMTGVVVTDNPETGYISRVGAVLSEQIDLYNNVTAVLANYGERITTLETAVQILQTSGDTVPNVNGYCFTSDQPAPITTVTEFLAQNSCDYNEVLGTVSDLNLAIAAEVPATLNAEDAYSQNSVMAGLTGWSTEPTDIAESFKNMWIAYNDARAGITKALEQSAPNCGDIKIAVTGAYNISTTQKNIVIYPGMTFVPPDSSSVGSLLLVTDVNGNSASTPFDAIEFLQDQVSIIFDITNTALTPVSSFFTATLQFGVVNTDAGLNCSSVYIIQIPNNQPYCPNVGAWAISGTTTVNYNFQPLYSNGVSYTLSLYDSADTSGTTVVASASYINPTGTTSGSFTGLQANHSYYIRTTIVINGAEITSCPRVNVNT